MGKKVESGRMFMTSSFLFFSPKDAVVENIELSLSDS